MIGIHVSTQFQADGYVVIESLLTTEECDHLRAKSTQFIDELDMSTHPKTVFSTVRQVEIFVFVVKQV